MKTIGRAILYTAFLGALSQLNLPTYLSLQSFVLAAAGGRTSESEAVRQHAEKDRGVAAPGRLANQDRKQTSARMPSSGEVSAVRQTGVGKTSTAAPQNGQNEPHYHPKGARATCG